MARHQAWLSVVLCGLPGLHTACTLACALCVELRLESSRPMYELVASLNAVYRGLCSCTATHSAAVKRRPRRQRNDHATASLQDRNASHSHPADSFFINFLSPAAGTGGAASSTCPSATAGSSAGVLSVHGRKLLWTLTGRDCRSLGRRSIAQQTVRIPQPAGSRRLLRRVVNLQFRFRMSRSVSCVIRESGNHVADEDVGTEVKAAMISSCWTSGLRAKVRHRG